MAKQELASETLIIGSPEPLKSIETKDGKARVGAYAIRFSDEAEKDLQGEYFTAKTYFGPRNGDGVDTLFHHGQPIADGQIFDDLAERVFPEAKTRKDEKGIFVETILDLADEYEREIAGLVEAGKLRWSSASASHAVRTTKDGEIKRWPPIEFSYTPTPAEPRLPAIASLKSVTVDAKTADDLAAAFAQRSEIRSQRSEVRSQKSDDLISDLRSPISDIPTSAAKRVDKPAQRMTEAEQAAKDAADKAQKDADIKSVNDRVDKREKEISEMYEIGDSINDRELARKFIKEGKTLDEFRAHVLTNVLKAKPVTTNMGDVGMSQKEVKKYSLRNAIFSMATKGRLEGVEKEAHEAAIKTLGRDIESKGFFVPDDVTRGFGRIPWKAGNNVTTATAGGFLVETDFGPMIELLRNKPQVVAAGATTLGGLVGDLALPVQTGASTAYWVSESGALTDSSATFGQKKLTPKRLGATIPYTTQFLAQASIDAEAFIRDDATRVLSIEKDRAALLGAGINGEPLGIANTPGINADVTYGASATWSKVVLSETGIGNDNADIGPMAWLLDSATVGKWKTILRDSVAGAAYLIQDGGLVNGYPYFKSNQVNAAHQSFFGVWSQLVMASWAGLEVIVDPYALKKSGQVEITFNELVDLVVRQPLSFNVSTDSAAQ